MTESINARENRAATPPSHKSINGKLSRALHGRPASDTAVYKLHYPFENLPEIRNNLPNADGTAARSSQPSRA